MKLFKIIFVIISILPLFFVGCIQENLSYDSKYHLSFSCDTIVFDTILINQASPTKKVRIYNENKFAINISSIKLASNSNSSFRINVDGCYPSEDNEIQDIVIKANDSIYVFIETTISDTSECRNIVVCDSILFSYNGNVDKLQLCAVAKNAIVLNKYILTENQVWDSKLPYLIFGYVYVPEGVKLKLLPGTQLLMHSGANIIVDGELNCDGSFESPIIIRGDRFDAVQDVDGTPYFFMPNQWGGIYLQNPQNSYKFKNVKIYGMSTGIVTLGSSRYFPMLEIFNSVIHTSGNYGIYSQNADVTINNSEISNCLSGCFVMYGGRCKVVHTTFANYYRYSARKVESFRVNNYVVQNGYKYLFPIDNCVVENSIIFGSLQEELKLDLDTNTINNSNCLFSHTLIKGKRVDNELFYNCRWAKSRNSELFYDTIFINTSIEDISKTGYYNFHLDSASYARGVAASVVSGKFPLDLDMKSRMQDGYPDMGCYEWSINY